jgi:DNA-directed RNA polymerase subunit L
MNVEVVKDEKELLEIQTDDLTCAEVLRSYLNNIDGVEMAVWKREHPTKPILMRIETSGKTAKKAVSEAVAAVKKDAEKIAALK